MQAGLCEPWGLGFRPLLRMVVVADHWPRRGYPSRPMAEADWPGAFLTLAEAWAAGDSVGPDRWQAALETVALPPNQDPEPLILLLATPLVLINASPYGHRRASIQAWGQSLGLTSSTLVVLDHYVQMVGQGGARGAAGASPGSPLPPSLEDLMTLVTSLQGQVLPTLTLADRWNWPSVTLALVGLLAILRSGPGGLPWPGAMGLDHRGNLGPRWRGYTLAQVDDLADALYGQWAGSSPVSTGNAYNG